MVLLPLYFYVKRVGLILIVNWQARPYKVEGTPVDVEEVYPRDNIDDGNQGMQSTNDTGALSVECHLRLLFFYGKTPEYGCTEPD
jgi:hypothetical protein